MLTASIVTLNILVLILIIISLKQRSKNHSDSLHPDIELEMDLDKLSPTHYLLEAGKNEWRLNDKLYNDPSALVIYALGLIFNNPIIYFDSEKLQITSTRIRLHFLLHTYSDEKLDQDQRVAKLADTFFEQREVIEPKLQELYKLPSKEENQTSNNLIDTLNRILNA
jgi:hypothetical protein